MRQKLEDNNFIASVQRGLEKTPQEVIEFLEIYCGFYSPVMSSNPYEIAYSGGKRDVILTIKAMMKGDLSPELITNYFKEVK